MKERRSLKDGILPNLDPELEKEFVFAGKPKSPDITPPQGHGTQEKKEGKGVPGSKAARGPLTTRVRSDFATALKRASLQRQLDGVFPHTLQDILEEALEPWLRSNGYLD